MLYTALCVSESGSFSNNPDYTEIVKSISGLKAIMEAWVIEHNRVGSDSSMASIWVKKGVYEEIDYPDFIVSMGPRGGVRFIPV